MAGAGRNPAPEHTDRSAGSGSLAPSSRRSRCKEVGVRSETPRSSHAAWEPRADRPDPIALLEEQAAKRVPELVPIRYGRMSASPFAFYRGAAYVMASDLAGTPQTGIGFSLRRRALANFGGFASAERQLLFDLNDFDETLPGPWEWDVKRLAASVAVAGRDERLQRRAAQAIVRQWSAVPTGDRPVRHHATLDVWYARAGRRRSGALRSQAAEANTAVREDGREGPPARQRASVREACRQGERRGAHPRRPAADGADPRTRRSRRSAPAGTPAASCWTPIAPACPVIAAGCWSAFAMPTWRGRWSGWGAWERVAG